MPYHVIIGRQIMLDGPMAFFTTGALLCLALGAARHARAGWLVAAGASIGLATLTKETAIIMIGSAFAFICLTSHMWRPVRFPLAGAGVALLLTFTYPILTALSGGSHSGQSYLLWQLTRQPNHDFGFYLFVVGAAMGFGLLAVAAPGAVRRPVHRPLDDLARGPAALVDPRAVRVLPDLAGQGILLPRAAGTGDRRCSVRVRWCLRSTRSRAPRGGCGSDVLVAGVVLSLVDPRRGQASQPPTTSGLAGAGGLPGGREVGEWVDTHVPLGSHLMTIGPSMGERDPVLQRTAV